MADTPDRASGLIACLQAARQAAARGADDLAKTCYLQALQHDSGDFDALHELATLAYASGHRSAAKSAWQRAIALHRDRPEAQVGLANVHAEEENWSEARRLYTAALQLQSDLAAAHQGLARVLDVLQEPAEQHWQQGFAGHAVVSLPYRGTGQGLPLLLLVCARHGNIPTRHWLDDRHFAITAVYAEFHDDTEELPEHALIVNLIGDADHSPMALQRAGDIVRRSGAPVINHPEQVARSDRCSHAHRMADIDALVCAAVTRMTRQACATKHWSYPMLLRAPGFHAGRHFYKVEGQEALAATLAALPGDDLLAIDFIDARGRDGLVRKFRVMFIDGRMYPLHLAISPDWKVHYFSAAMADNPAYRAEEALFLQDMPATLGKPAMAALQTLQARLALDFAGVDFALTADGRVLLFECNATMALYPVADDPRFEHRRAAVTAALHAARSMLERRAQRGERMASWQQEP